MTSSPFRSADLLPLTSPVTAGAETRSSYSWLSLLFAASSKPFPSVPPAQRSLCNLPSVRFAIGIQVKMGAKMLTPGLSRDGQSFASKHYSVVYPDALSISDCLCVPEFSILKLRGRASRPRRGVAQFSTVTTTYYHPHANGLLEGCHRYA